MCLISVFINYVKVWEEFDPGISCVCKEVGVDTMFDVQKKEK